MIWLQVGSKQRQRILHEILHRRRRRWVMGSMRQNLCCHRNGKFLQKLTPPDKVACHVPSLHAHQVQVRKRKTAALCLLQWFNLSVHTVTGLHHRDELPSYLTPTRPRTCNIVKTCNLSQDPRQRGLCRACAALTPRYRLGFDWNYQIPRAKALGLIMAIKATNQKLADMDCRDPACSLCECRHSRSHPSNQ